MLVLLAMEAANTLYTTDPQWSLIMRHLTIIATDLHTVHHPPSLTQTVPLMPVPMEEAVPWKDLPSISMLNPTVIMVHTVLVVKVTGTSRQHMITHVVNLYCSLTTDHDIPEEDRDQLFRLYSADVTIKCCRDCTIATWSGG